MGEKKFIRKEAFDFGWEKMKKHFWFFVGLFIISFVCSGIQNYFGDFDNRPQFLVNLIGFLIFWILGIVIQMGMIRIVLQIHDGTETGFDQLFTTWKYIINYSLGSLLYGLIVLAGLVLLIVPGIMWAIRFQLFAYFIIDKGAGPVEALKLSSKATEGARLDLFWFNLMAAWFILLGVLALFIGLFAAIPTILMASAYVFRKLQSKMQ